MVYLSLGSNMGDREGCLSAAVTLISQEIGHVTAQSDIFETEPWGFTSANAFLNQALAVETSLPPEEILTITQRIEREIGRTAKTENGQYGDRLIDIDLLMYDDMTVCTEKLKLPHPLMTVRRFVLEPLAQIAPDVVHPVLHITIRELLQNL